ncbi:hypothetical protein B9Z55_026454 [Caenorhabditis nigoni]|uniref:PH domain-containing protein n=1 Tax=Caenorhabditis nigoni TaxID=1611254 RepID=A0A2G5T384_9PELO|nr:hypothetical protein B9Z55_026454 [Caenorhabditis nigoni]
MWGRRPIDVEDSFDYSSDEQSSSPSAARPSNSQATRKVRDMIARWNAQELDRITARNSKLGKTPSSSTVLLSEDKAKEDKEESNEKLGKTASSIPQIPSEDKVKEDKDERTPPPPARSACEPSTSSAKPRQTDRQSISSTSPEFPKSLDKLFEKLRSYYRFLGIAIENLPKFLEEELPKKARKNLKIEELVEALEGVRKVFEMFESHKTKEVSQLVIRVGSFVKTCLHAISIAEHLARDVEESKDKNDQLKEAFRKFERQYFMTPNGDPSNILSKLYSMRHDLEGCGPTLGKVVETTNEEKEKKTLAQEVVRKLENVGRPYADSQKDLQMKMKAILHEKFQGKLDVYKNARYVIKDGPVRKQSRNKTQGRHLVLFSDLFCVCRLQSPWYFWKKQNFNVKKTKILDINEIQINPDTPEDGKFLEISSPLKSFSFHFESKEEKTAWVKAIQEAQEHASERIGRKNLKQAMELKMLKPIRVPKADVTECMIEECGSSFTMLSKRKSCKNCGIAICSRCVGHAPLANTEYNQGNVCPDCYDKLVEEYDAGTLFPDNIADVSKGKLRVKIGKEWKNPSSLFTKPQNFGLKKKNFEERETDKIAADYVYIKDANGKEKRRFVYIRKSDHTLRVFRSKYDSALIGEEECLSPLVMEGFKVDLKTDGWHFQLKRKYKMRNIEIRIEDPDIDRDWEMSLGPIFERKWF